MAARVAVNSVATGYRKALDSAIPLANGLLSTTQGLLASALSTDLSALIQSMVTGPATIYDKAMDAEYLATYIGGGNHRGIRWRAHHSRGHQDGPRCIARRHYHRGGDGIP